MEVAASLGRQNLFCHITAVEHQLVHHPVLLLTLLLRWRRGLLLWWLLLLWRRLLMLWLRWRLRLLWWLLWWLRWWWRRRYCLLMRWISV